MYKITISIICIFIVFTILQSLIFVKALSGDNLKTEQKIIDLNQHIITQSKLILSKSEYCINNNTQICSSDFFDGLIQTIKYDLKILKTQIANEKEFASISSINAFDLIAVTINQYVNDGDINELKKDLKSDILSIENTYQNLLSNYQNKIIENRNNYLKYFTIIGFANLIFISLALFIIIIKNKNSPKDKNTNDNLKSMDIIYQFDKKTINQSCTDIAYSEIERKIFAKLLKIIEDQESLQRRIDLHISLYNVIGFQIRDITNKIIGGMDILTDGMNESSALTAKQISVAAISLEGLAENFNQLFSVGQVSHSDTIYLYKLLTDITVSLSSKTIHNGYVMESYFDRNCPPSIYGNYVNLFCFLLIQLSNEITSYQAKNSILLVSSGSNKDIEKVTLKIEIIFTDNFNIGLSNLKSLNWKELNNDNVSNKNLMKHLLQENCNFKIKRFAHNDLYKTSVIMDILPASYPNNEKPLNGYVILICGNSVTQIDTIATTLEDFGAKIKYAKTPNDVFKFANSSEDYDAVLITNTLEGINLPSFCRTLHNILTRKRGDVSLFASMVDPISVKDISEFVDQVFYRPTDPVLMVKDIKESLEGNQHEKVVDNAKIMIVEDDGLQQMILGRILTEMELEFKNFETGEDAIKAVKIEKPDIIFMDCIMPGMGGIEATRSIREFEKQNIGYETITIIGASAVAGDENKKECIVAGMDLMVSKPYNQDEITKVVKKFLAAKHNQKKEAA